MAHSGRGSSPIRRSPRESGRQKSVDMAEDVRKGNDGETAGAQPNDPVGRGTLVVGGSRGGVVHRLPPPSPACSHAKFRHRPSGADVCLAEGRPIVPCRSPPRSRWFRPKCYPDQTRTVTNVPERVKFHRTLVPTSKSVLYKLCWSGPGARLIHGLARPRKHRRRRATHPYFHAGTGRPRQGYKD